MNEDFMVEGTRIRALPQERVVNVLGGARRRGLYVTNFRLIYMGWNRLFKVIPIPGEEIRQIALLQDVDFVGTVIRKLPFPILLIGLWAALGGFGSAVAGPGGFWGVLVGVVGLGLIAAWLFFKWRFLRFTVSGAKHFEYDLVYAVTEARQADEFLNDLFEQKFALSRGQPAPQQFSLMTEPAPAPAPPSLS